MEQYQNEKYILYLVEMLITKVLQIKVSVEH